MPQATQLSFPFTAFEVVRLGASVPGFGHAGAGHAVMDALGVMRMAGLADRPYTRLSGGERQRVHVARALCQLDAAPVKISASMVLLLDEPTSGLDFPHQTLLLDQARREAEKGRIVVAVLHDLNLAAGWADRIALIGQGRVAAFGRPSEVIDNDLLSDLFAHPVRVNVPPRDGSPYVLPHSDWQGERV